jgi:hypothetical protein
MIHACDSSQPGAGARACINRIRGDVSTSHQSWALVTWPRVGALDALMEEEAVDQRTASLETDDGVRLTVRASERCRRPPRPPDGSQSHHHHDAIITRPARTPRTPGADDRWQRCFPELWLASLPWVLADTGSWGCLAVVVCAGPPDRWGESDGLGWSVPRDLPAVPRARRTAAADGLGGLRGPRWPLRLSAVARGLFRRRHAPRDADNGEGGDLACCDGLCDEMRTPPQITHYRALMAADSTPSSPALPPAWPPSGAPPRPERSSPPAACSPCGARGGQGPGHPRGRTADAQSPRWRHVGRGRPQPVAAWQRGGGALLSSSVVRRWHRWASGGGDHAVTGARRAGTNGSRTARRTSCRWESAALPPSPST